MVISFGSSGQVQGTAARPTRGPRLYSPNLSIILPNSSALGRTLRSRVAGSMATRPKWGAKPSAHSKLSIRVQ
jgi:hypothetical protein